MTPTENATKLTRIIACAVFKPAIDSLQLKRRYPHLRLTYLPSHLHLRPKDLKKRMRRAITAARIREERVICIYGECFPEIDDFCRQSHVLKVPGHYCYEMLLGRDRFRHLMEETAGTYFAERNLLLNFEEYCVIPLELQDEEMKRYCFGHYQRLVYIRQPSDADLTTQADEVSRFLGLSLDVADVDYSYLEKMLTDLLD